MNRVYSVFNSLEEFKEKMSAPLSELSQPLKELRNKKTADLREPLLAQLHKERWLLILDGLERVLVAYYPF